MIQRVVGMFESQHFQRILAYGLLGLEYDDDLDVDDYDGWPHQRNGFHGYQGNDGGLDGNRPRSSSSVYQRPLSYPSARDSRSLSSVKVQPRESDSERKARLLQEAKKSKEKAEKKRLKKQKQKQRKQMEKEKQNEEGNAAEDCKSDAKKHDPNPGAKMSPAAKGADSDGGSSEEVSSDEDDATKNDSDAEELDMTSTFVSKAALIAKRKLEQKQKFEKEKKKSPEKEKSKSVPDRKDPSVKEAHKKNSVAPICPTFEDNVKISTDLAIMGNKFASTGDYNMAVKYFTDAIKCNPKEFKLFGNRSFCFEKLQEYEKALTDAELSLGICPGWIKGLFRKGRALAGLKRYEEAARAFRDVLKQDSSYAEAAQELMRVQIIQLMEYGFTREQSSNALIIHGTVNKALEVLSKLHHQPGAVLNDALPPVQVANVTGVSPVLSASAHPSPAAAQPYEGAGKPLQDKPLGPTQNTSNVRTVKMKNDYNQPPPELFPIWVGNLTYPLTESMITNLFSKVGPVYSVKLLSYKRCAFVNFTKQEHCDEAIRRFHGYMMNRMRIAVRYPDRIPPGMGISRSALRAHDLHESLGEQADGRRAAGGQKC
ncbi:tetratricopeptide repeat protein 31-like isoform X2 [Kryptolebias marmoratus]|nr:tetratricopeptide repeat protein 31-like isoform X2 [Kryptolebias marmoratus]